MIIEIKTEKSVETNYVGLIDTLSYNPSFSKVLVSITHLFGLSSVICRFTVMHFVVHFFIVDTHYMYSLPCRIFYITKQLNTTVVDE